MANHPQFGLLLAAFGALVLTPDALFMRLSGMGTAPMLAWRGLLMGGALVLAWLVLARGRRRADLGALLSGAGLTVAASQFFNSTLFSYGIATAPVPVVLFGVAAVPAFAAVFARLLAGEPTHWSTWATIAAVATGIAVAVLGDGIGPGAGHAVGPALGPDAGSAVGPEAGPDAGAGVGPGGGPAVGPDVAAGAGSRAGSSAGSGAGSGAGGWDAAALRGALAGLGVAATLALIFVTLRARPGVPILPAIGCGAILAGSAGLVSAGPAGVFDGAVWAIAVSGALILPVSFFALSLASRHTHASNVSLLLLLETVLGPAWVWAVLGERPTAAMILGGAIVVLSLAAYLLYMRRRTDPEAAPPVLPR